MQLFHYGDDHLISPFVDTGQTLNNNRVTMRRVVYADVIIDDDSRVKGEKSIDDALTVGGNTRRALSEKMLFVDF